MLDPDKDQNSKCFWKYIKSRKQDSSEISTLKQDGIIADTAQAKADLLKSQFTSVFTTENLSNSQGARFLKNDLAQLSSQKRFDFRNS